MTDREMLELAAKAADYSVITWQHDKFICKDKNSGDHKTFHWNPLNDDGDALRLAVKLRLDVDHNQEQACVYGNGVAVEIPEGSDPCKATRRAIVRAAAEIGRNMP